MALIGRFIGINNYLDPGIRELNGAKRDATALWALFADTLPEMQSKLLVDEDATVKTIRDALQESLGNAKEEDTVIVFYSGHGSHNHELAAHDSVLTDLPHTTVSMQEVADLFKESKAKSILCILDACFSGGAPAKVIEDSPIPKDLTDPFQALAGEGRILLSASNHNELSYEQPGTGHGLLTKAILDILQSSEDTVDLTSAISKIMELVRAEASRMGVIQTPVLLGHITGGLTFPSLKAGEQYYEAFPEKKGVRISNAIKDLATLGLPSAILTEWQSNFPNGLNDLQIEAINEYRILEGESLLVVAPTSSGKTFIGELASIRAITEGRKSVFLLPYRALVNEKFDQFSKLYGEKLDLKVIRCTGDYLDHTDAFIKGKYDIALLTYEMFLNLSISVPAILNTIGLVVLDEGQFITDPTRGINVELLLTNLLTARNLGINPQLIVLSAVIGDSNDFEKWLQCKKLITTKRPIPLLEGVMDRRGIFKYLDAEGNIKNDQILPNGSIHIRKEKASNQDLIVPLVKSLIEKGEKVIVFRNQKGFAVGCARYLSRELGLPSAVEAINQLPTHDTSSSSAELRDCLSGGTAFHNTDLNRDEKAIVERVYRDPNSKIRALGATTTLAAGLNTPASTVILAEQEFVGDDGRPFTVAEYKNMAGRAGRLGFNEKGKAIILADSPTEQEMLFDKYVMGRLESLSSAFNADDLDTWVVRLLAQVKKIRRVDITTLLANTYGGYLANKHNPNWANTMSEQIEQLVEKMIQLNLVEQEGEFINLTMLGKVCGESSLSFKSAIRFVEVLKQYQKTALTELALVALVQILPELDDTYTPMMKNGTREYVRASEAASRYGDDLVRLFQQNTDGDNFNYYGRCKRAAILFDWINGYPTEAIEKTFTTNPYRGRIGYGEIRRFADMTRFMLKPCYQISTLVSPGQKIDENIIDSLLKRLEVGLPSAALTLLQLPIVLSRGEYLALYNSGIKTSSDVIKTTDQQLKGVLGEKRAIEIKKIMLVES